MIKNITLGQYIPGNSILHRSDPRVKIILTLIYSIAMFLLNNYFGFIMSTLFTLVAIIGSGIPLKFTLKGLKSIAFIILFASVVNMLTIKGTPLFDLAFIHISYEGVDTAVKLAWRLILVITGASLLTLTTTPILLTDGIEKLLDPFKRFGVPSHEIAMMMTIALRFIPTLLEETDKIMKAQAARGADFDTGNFIQKAKSFVPVLVPLFVSAFRRADELATAMEARCYRGSEGRTRMRQLKLGKVDVIVTSILVIFIAGVMILQYRFI